MTVNLTKAPAPEAHPFHTRQWQGTVHLYLRLTATRGEEGEVIYEGLAGNDLRALAATLPPAPAPRTTICSLCDQACDAPSSIEVDPLCPSCARTLPSRPLPEVATIEDCGHDLRHAAADAEGDWFCLHPAHNPRPLLITTDPISLF